MTTKMQLFFIVQISVASTVTGNPLLQKVDFNEETSNICGYKFKEGSDGNITYDQVYTKVDTDGSVLNAASGVYTTGVAGVYEITVSVSTTVTSGEHVFVGVYGVPDGFPTHGNVWLLEQQESTQTRYKKLRAGDGINIQLHSSSDASCVNVVMPLDNVSQSFPLFCGLLFKV